MSEMKLAILGAAGRMGGALIRAIDETPGTVLSGALEQEGSSALGKDSGILTGIGENGITISHEVGPALEAADAVIDFTVPQSTVVLARKAGNFDCVHIIGTTGCDQDQDQEILDAAKNATIVKSGNMSLGVNLLAALVEQAAAALDANQFDIEVLEMHHKHKVDAPSGTALLLGEAAAKGRAINLTDNAVKVRDGITGARESGSIGFATLRGGAVVGDHTVILASSGERIELSHKAQDRSLFANGAIRAALWARNKPAGLYSMRDVLGL